MKCEKMLKRSAAGALALLLTMGCVGCKNGKGTSSDTDIGGGKYDVIGKNEEDLTFESLGLPKLDIKSDKVKYLLWSDKSELENPQKWYYQVNMVMKKYYNCELEFISTTYEELPTKAAQMVLSGQSPDIIFYKSQDNPGFIKNNIVQPVDDYIDLKNKYVKDSTLDDMTVNGKHYMLGSISNNGRVYYWKQKFTDIGEKTPLELYKEGKWTLSKFKELAKKLTVDSNGDGTPEVYGCNVDMLYAYTACGEDFVKFNSDGTAVNNMKSPAISKMMSFIQGIGKSGDNSNGGSFNDGTAVMLWNESWMAGTMGEKFKAGTVEYAPSPKMDGSDTYYVPGRLNTDWLAAGAPNPGGAMAYFVCGKLFSKNEQLSKRYNEIQAELTGYTDEMVELNKELEDKSKFVPIISRMEGIGNWDSAGMWKMIDEVSKWGTPWTTCLETYYSAFQAEIDRANGK